MKKGSYIQSENGIYKFTLNETGKLEIWCKNEKIWWTNTSSDDNLDAMYFDENGTFYLRGKDQKVLWRTENESEGVKLELLLLQNDGNLAGYDKCGNRVWSTRTSSKCLIKPGMHSRKLHLFIHNVNLHISCCICRSYRDNVVLLRDSIHISLNLDHNSLTTYSLCLH